MSSDTWKGSNGAWTTAADWTAGTPTSTSAVIIDSGEPIVTAAITIASLTNLATLDFMHAGTSTITGSVTNAGFFDVDDQRAIGGTNLTVGGTFANTGYLEVGFDNTLSASDTIRVGAIVNGIGEIDLSGGATSANAVLFDVTGAGGASFGVANTVTGAISLSGFSTVEFQAGEFTTIASGATLSLDGPHAFIADAASLNANSALSKLNLIAGTLDLVDGAKISTAGALHNINQLEISTDAGATPTTLAVGAAFLNAGTTSVDNGGLGGSVMTVKGAVTNDGSFYLGSGGLRQASTVTTTAFINDGVLSISSGLPTAALALVNVTGAAGFGQVGVLQGDVALSGNSEVRFASGQITSIAEEGELALAGLTARVADAASSNSSSALTGLKDIAGTLELLSGNVLTTGALTIGSFGEVDVDTAYALGGTGGSSLTVGGAVTNFGTFNLGDDLLTGSSHVTVNSFVNTDGRLVVAGSFDAPEQALLTVKGAAGFRIAGHLSGYVGVGGDASIAFASGQITTIDSGSTLSLFGPQATVADVASPTTNSALTGLATIVGELDIDDGVKIATTGRLTNDGDLQVDGTFGGSVLTVKQTLVNHGDISIGASSLEQNSQVSAAAINNTGELSLAGGAAAGQYAILNVAAAAGFGTAGQVTGDVSLSGRSRILFTGTGVLTTIDANAAVSLDGATAVIANASSATTNSALKGLAANAGILDLSDGASVATSGGLNNTDYIEIDSTAEPKVSGGSKLTLGGVLKNSGTIEIGTEGNTAGDTVTATGLVNSDIIGLFGASSAAQATISITGAAGFGAAGALSGSVTEGGYSSIHFASGQIAKIASGATLDLEGAHAFVSEGAVAGNSALTGLKAVVGNLELDNGASLTTSAGLNVTGTVTVDSGEFGEGGGSGGSKLNVGGTLVDSGVVNIGNSGLSQAVVAFAKLLSNAGSLDISGGASAATKAELDVAGAAGAGTAGVLTGDISLSGYSALRFASGLITTLQSGGSLTLDGAHAVVAAGTATTNTALEGLKTIAGTLTIDDGASFATTGALGVSGQLEIDTNSFENPGGSKITVGGALTNSGFDLSIGNANMTTTSEVIASSFGNTGEVTLTGGESATAQALIDITGAAGFGTAGVVQGEVTMSDYSAVEFGSGAITSVGLDADLSLSGAHAFIEKGATNSNSALTGLTSNSGTLSLQAGAIVAPTGNFTNNGQLYVDEFGIGGSQFKITGKLTNNNGVNIGNSADASQAYISAGSLTNNSFIDLAGGSGGDAEFNVSGGILNDGEFDFNSGTEILNGAVTGSGSFNLEGGSTLELGGSVSSGQTVSFSGADQLKLAANATTFAALISGFGAGDTVDLTTFGTGTTHTFASGVLTLHSGANVAKLNFGGGSVASEFTVTSAASGTVVSFH